MSVRSNMIYRYDGTYEGFLCCVAQCFFSKEVPLDIRPVDEAQQSLFGFREVPTDPALARRVERSIPKKMGSQALRLVREGFLTCMEQREMALLRFLLLGYRVGPRVTGLTTHPAVHPLQKAVLTLRNEAHHVLEFLRFADCGEFLAARIAPNNTVLPLVAPHFCDRLPNENFMIYDGNHGMGFLHRADTPGEFFQADALQLPEPSAEELRWQGLWKVFYRTIAVEGRVNHKLRQSLCPKRFWSLMPEMDLTTPEV